MTSEPITPIAIGNAATNANGIILIAGLPEDVWSVEEIVGLLG